MITGSKRHVCLFAAAWILGIVLVYRPPGFGIFLCIALAGCLGTAFVTDLTLYKRAEKTLIVYGIVAAVAITSFFCCQYQRRGYRSIQNQLQNAAEITLTGVVCKKEQKSEHYLYYLKQTAYRSEMDRGSQNTEFSDPYIIKNGRILAYMDGDEIPIGSVVRLKGTIRCFEHATNEGQFDMADYYQSQHISFRIFPEKADVIRSGSFSLKERLYQLQKQISQIFLSQLNTRDAGILNTMVLGNRGMLDSEIRQYYQNAGVSHILAISGLHISILGVSIFRIFRKCRCTYLSSAVIGGSVIFCYACMSGMAVSTQRAFVMYLLMIGAQVLGRTYDPVNAMAIAALVILIPNPGALFQSGFLFSFTAIAAIVFFLPKTQIKKEIPKNGRAGIKQRLMCIARDIKNRVVSGLILQLFLLPVTAWFYYEVPVCALFLNLLVIPLCSWLLGFGLAGGICGLAVPELSKGLLVVCHMILNLYDRAIGVTNGLPFARVITGRPKAWIIILFYLFLGVICLWYRGKKEPSFSDAFRIRLSECHATFIRKRFLYFRRIPMAVRATSAAIFLIMLMMIAFPVRDPFQITFLDVGQGDGICISDGDGKHIMIDGGSSSENEVGKYRIEPFLKYHAVKHIDAWILTHGDYDHYSGFLELMKDGYRVDYLLLAKPMSRDETWSRLVRAAEDNGTKVIYVEAGDGLNLKNGKLQCLYPSDSDRSDDPNDLSQVWLLEMDGLSVLFTGDIGEKQERLLIERNLLRDIAVLKTAHHGSRFSSCEEFLADTAPEYAVISCGENNRYGHPHEEAVERLEAAGADLYRTDTAGAVTIRKNKKRYVIETFGE